MGELDFFAVGIMDDNLGSHRSQAHYKGFNSSYNKRMFSLLKKLTFFSDYSLFIREVAIENISIIFVFSSTFLHLFSFLSFYRLLLLLLFNFFRRPGSMDYYAKKYENTRINEKIKKNVFCSSFPTFLLFSLYFNFSMYQINFFFQRNYPRYPEASTCLLTFSVAPQGVRN